MEAAEIRSAVREQIHLLAHSSEQLQYERNALVGHVPAELVSMFCEDVYHPKNAAFLDAFTEEELKGLAHLYGLLVEASRFPVSTVEELLKLPEWRRVLRLAQHLEAHYEEATA